MTVHYLPAPAGLYAGTLDPGGVMLEPVVAILMFGDGYPTLVTTSGEHIQVNEDGIAGYIEDLRVDLDTYPNLTPMTRELLYGTNNQTRDKK